MTTHLGPGDDDPDESVVPGSRPLHALVQSVRKEHLPVAHALDCGGVGCVVRWEGLRTEQCVRFNKPFSVSS